MEKKKKVEGATATRAEKKDRTKNLIRETLAQKEYKHNDLIEETAKIYSERFQGEETENINDVKGRIGSVLDIMKKEGELTYEGGVYALKTEKVEEKPKKKTKKATETPKTEEKPKKRTTKKKTDKTEEAETPIAPVEPVPAPIVEEKKEENKKAEKPKKTTKKKEEKVETPIEEKVEEPKQEEPLSVVEEKPVEENAVEEKAKEKDVVDMSFLFGARKQEKLPEKEIKQEKVVEKEIKQEEVKKVEEKKTFTKKIAKTPIKIVKKAPRVMTAEERLKESFLNRLHRLGGDYFEYYSVYLLERYCRLNGRRLEGLKITSGDRDGGIDGEIELTDKFGFRETIYIQSKNWDPEKGDEKLWVVGETLLQQFIGACICRQAKEGKQHCRGIFITTSRFTTEAKAILDTMSEKIIGYDGTDLFEAAKECQFGIVKKNGEWVLDENLLSSGKAFFNLF